MNCHPYFFKHFFVFSSNDKETFDLVVVKRMSLFFDFFQSSWKLARLDAEPRRNGERGCGRRLCQVFDVGVAPAAVLKSK